MEKKSSKYFPISFLRNRENSAEKKTLQWMNGLLTLISVSTYVSDYQWIDSASSPHENGWLIDVGQFFLGQFCDIVEVAIIRRKI